MPNNTKHIRKSKRDKFYPVTVPPETELLFKYLEDLKEQLLGYGHKYTVNELYDDVPTRVYFMLRVFNELDFFALYPASTK